jgi:hypothetical protein
MLPTPSCLEYKFSCFLIKAAQQPGRRAAGTGKANSFRYRSLWSWILSRYAHQGCAAPGRRAADTSEDWLTWIEILSINQGLCSARLTS